MIETFTSLYHEHEALLGIIVALSVFMLIAGILSLPFLVSLIPADYFQLAAPYTVLHHFEHPVIRVLVIITKNALGWLLVLLGIILLFLPGQGLLTLVLGLILVDFPGKRAVERRLVGNHSILHAINWLREKRHKAPLLAPE